jgi:hypothetical protein
VRRVHFVRGERALDEPVPLVRPRDSFARRLRARHALGRARRKVRRYEPARRARNLTYAVRLQLGDYARNLRRRHPLILLEHFFRFFLFFSFFLFSYHAHFFSRARSLRRCAAAPLRRGAPRLFLDFFFTFVPFLFFSFYSFHQNRISLVHVLLTKMRGTGTTFFFFLFSFFFFFFLFFFYFFPFFLFSFFLFFLFFFSFFKTSKTS